MSLKRLKQIKKDNYIGEGGKEYCPFEVESLIVEKMQKKGIEESTKAIKEQNEMIRAMEHAERVEIEETRKEFSWALAGENFINEMKQMILQNGVLV